jgi:Tfp pilus assembly protein PilF
MICSRGEPAYGYATLAQLLSHKDYGRFCNTVLTTNFDDLIADALYLYGERNARPLVVTHEALARYVRTNSPRPTVVKLHGDAHLDPKNLQPETREIDVGLAKQLYPFLQDHALVFVGYGGNDESILKFVQECPIPALAPPIYWISKREPPAPFARWLLERNALRVDHTDFDQLMHLIRGALSIELLDRSRWTQIGYAYYEAFEKLKDEIDTVSASVEDTEALKAATSETAKSLPDDWSYYSHARQLERSDKAQAEKIFQDGLGRFPDSAILISGYANFLSDFKNDYEGAERYYRKVLEIDPKRASSLGNYALLLYHRLDMDGAEALYKRAIEANPKHANNLCNYAVFLKEVRDDVEGAEALYKLAIEADPKHANSLSNYALFVTSARNDFDTAESLYKRAIEADPKHATSLGRYAAFLRRFRKDFDASEALYKRAIEVDPEQHANNLGNYAIFLNEVRDDADAAEAFFKRAIEADPQHANNLCNYATFLWQRRKDLDQAEAFYERAVNANPKHVSSINKYALFLEKIRNDPKAAAKYRVRDKTSGANTSNKKPAN